ncbi:cadherin-like beta sandwich domain-containing protein [Paenibacillus koleovorans]|uniref:cadherin-like beta sandwich domain-containing protein n=1 Tax=Paenibacillus koleovorans TaxID=121608 RepID=UPI001FE9D0A7|nr:cadherin-like beta sandwich domain-containing protein [Paenibacillus koleovorans]
MRSGKTGYVRTMLLLLLAAGFGTVWAVPSMAAVSIPPPEALVAADDFSSNTGLWDFIGSASRTSNYVELTPSQDNKAGVLWLKQKLAPPFNISFSFRIDQGGTQPADGLVFLFNKQKNTSPVSGGGLGFEPGNGYGVEFDTYRNAGDPSAPHMSLFRNNTDHTIPGTLLSQATPPNFIGSSFHTVKIEVTATTVKAYLDGTLRLNWTGTLDNTYEGIGFAAATGASTSRHVIDDVVITRPFSNNAKLGSLAVDGHPFVFSPDTPAYNLTVPYESDTATLRYTKADTRATVTSVTSTVTNAVYGFTQTEALVGLQPGPNPIQLTVTAENGTASTYTLTIMRNHSSNAYIHSLQPLGRTILAPDFRNEISDYALYVPATEPLGLLSMTLSDPNATYSLRGIMPNPMMQLTVPTQLETTVTASTYSEPQLLMLDPQQYGIYELAVLAQDQTTTRTYRFHLQPVPEQYPIAFARIRDLATIEVAFPMPVVLPAQQSPAMSFPITGAGDDLQVVQAQIIPASQQTPGISATVLLQLNRALLPTELPRLSLLHGAVASPTGQPVLQLFAPVLTTQQLISYEQQLDILADGLHIDDVARYMLGPGDKDFNGNGQLDRFDVYTLLRLLLP